MRCYQNKRKLDGARVRLKTGRALSKTGIFALLILFSLIFVIPFYWSLLTSVRPNDEIFSSGLQFWPEHITWEHYEKAFSIIPFFQFSLNTLLITACIIVSNLLFCSMAGYAFAKIQFRGGKLVYRLMLFSVMIPSTVLLIPQFLVLARFPLVGGNNLFGQGGYGFSGNFLGVVLPTAISVFNILFMRSFFISLPNELGEAGRIDGSGEARIFFQLYLPLAKPAMATLSVFCFQAGWNSFLWPNVILRSGNFKVLTQGLASFTVNNSVDYGPMMAATVCATIPVLIVFLFAQKYFIQGIAFSGTKS